MKTLVIHPSDRTTYFLSEMYQDKPEYTVLSGNDSRAFVCAMIERSDRIIMLGHGSPDGLFGKSGGFVIDGSIAPLLQNKDCIGIWCHASDFAKDYKLTGFFSGMFISELSEAFIFDIDTTQRPIDISNELFAELMQKVIHKPTSEIAQYLMKNYKNFECPVVDYNRERLIYLKDGEDMVKCLS